MHYLILKKIKEDMKCVGIHRQGWMQIGFKKRGESKYDQNTLREILRVLLLKHLLLKEIFKYWKKLINC